MIRIKTVRDSIWKSIETNVNINVELSIRRKVVNSVWIAVDDASVSPFNDINVNKILKHKPFSTKQLEESYKSLDIE